MWRAVGCVQLRREFLLTTLADRAVAFPPWLEVRHIAREARVRRRPARRNNCRTRTFLLVGSIGVDSVEEFVEDGSSFLIAKFLIGSEIGQADSAVGADSPIREVVFLQEFDNMGARHTEDVGGLLGGDFLVFWHEEDGAALSHGC